MSSFDSVRIMLCIFDQIPFGHGRRRGIIVDSGSSMVQQKRSYAERTQSVLFMIFYNWKR